MANTIVRIFISLALLSFFFTGCMSGGVQAAQKEIIMGTVIKKGKGFVLEADDGDYRLKGKDLSKLVGKLVEVTGIITESDRGDSIEVLSVEDLEETQPD